MWLNEGPPVYKRDLVLEKPFVNTPGTLGFCPDPHNMPFISHLGAFITHPISRRPRQPAKNRACLPFPGGFLLHTGLPNPGISRAIRAFRRCWENAPLPIIVHLLAEAPGTLADMIRKLEGLENILAVEISLPPQCDPTLLEALMDAALGELPVILSLSPEQVPLLLKTIETLQPSAIHLCQPRGTLPSPDGENLNGRLYGSAVFPVVLNTLQNQMDLATHIIAGGGIYTHQQAESMFRAGATTVALGAVLWQVHRADFFAQVAA